MLNKRLGFLILALIIPMLTVFLIGGVLAGENIPEMLTLSVSPVSSEPVPAGDPAVFKVVLDNMDGQNRPNLYLDLAWDKTLVQRARIEVVQEETMKVNTQGVRRTEGKAGWQGGIAQDGRLTLLVTLLPAICYDDPITIELQAEAGGQDGGGIFNDTGTMNVSCSPNPFTDENVDISMSIDTLPPYEIFDSTADVLQGLNARVQVNITNNGEGPLNALINNFLAPQPEYTADCAVMADQVRWQAEGAATLSFDRGFLPPALKTSSNADDQMLLQFEIQDLKPGDTWTGDLLVPLRGRIPGCQFSGFATVYPGPAIPIPGSCEGGSPPCRYQGWTTRAEDLRRLFTILEGYDSNEINARLVAPDLGDAPASENSFNDTAMSAYNGVPANFPTVFDLDRVIPSVQPQADHREAPLHLYSRPLRLGNLASAEREADIPPGRNIVPLQDQSNLDARDDGWPLGELPDSCQPWNQKVRITIEDWALDYFDGGGTAYLNVFVDANGDGDWEDITSCGQSQVPEHIFINLPIFVADLGTGQHEIELPDNVGINWQTDQTWLRVTLSDQPAPLPLIAGGIDRGDGRGPVEGYVLGETEDYRFRVGQGLDSLAAFGADIALGMETNYQFMANHSAGTVQLQATDCLTCIDPCYGGGSIITLGNLGDLFAPQSKLTVWPDPALRSSDVQISVAGDLPWTDDLPVDIACSPADPDCRIEIGLGDIPPQETGSLVVYASASCREDTQACKKTAYTVKAKVESAGDVNNSNNQVQNNIAVPLPPEWLEPPKLIYPIPGTTVGPDLNIQAAGIPGRKIAAYLNGVKVATGDVNGDGLAYMKMTDIPGESAASSFQLAIGYDGIPGGKRNPTRPIVVVVDNANRLFIDPMSLVFKYIEQDNVYKFHPWDESGRVDPNGWQVPLLEDGKYDIEVTTTSWTGCLTCTMRLADGGITLKYGNDQTLATLTYDEGGGLWNGTFIAAKEVLDKPLYLEVTADGEEQVFTGESLTQPGLPKLVDAQTGQAVDGADYAMWQRQSVIGGQTIWVRPSAMNGQPLPRTTGKDGQMFFNVAPGIYRLSVILEEGGAPILTEPQRLFGTFPDGNVAINRPEFGVGLNNLSAQEIKVSITPDGFDPPVLAARTGDIITWQNISLQERGVFNAEEGINSGLLTPNRSFSLSFDQPGIYTVADPQNPQNAMLITVSSAPAGGKLFMPVIQRP